ncbi:hypothetical protein T4C_2504 [Trichinella pseudospiralis]|uniref:Uncharacterized protein n=1 Tax=Trichinella pseudospiralis TaxID=6337 RepID=A0A0V1IXC5_TRIPS|nr:hypothetical protein T4C_2504 [Trichinella pseudospiralis]
MHCKSEVRKKDTSAKIDHYGLLRVGLGLTCSPFLGINNVQMRAIRHQDAAARRRRNFGVHARGLKRN